MEKISTYNDLLKKYKECKKKIEVRENPEKFNNDEIKERHILICGGPGCKASNSDNILKAFNEEITRLNLQEDVKVIMTGCFGFCAKGPVIEIMPDKVFYIKVSEEDVKEIIESHILEGRVVDRLLYENEETKEKIKIKEEIPFYKKQVKIALKNCGVIDPENMEDALGVGAYTALGKVLTTMTQEEVIKEVSESGLRGRGGGGFPTGRKWEAARRANGDVKYVICNADEGDPGAFMDRAILEGDPNLVLEAMAICGYAIGASKGYIYIRAEYPLAVHRLKVALKQAKDIGLLGSNILNTGFNFDIEIKYGAGAFVCGEATALIHSIEGLRGEPTMKPPRTSEKGLWQRPTCVNNVETFANVSQIINNGAEWYSSIGAEKSAGTKVFALAGNINNVGLVEIPMGMPLRDIVYEIGGGIINNKALKAIQTGGPSGGCIPVEYLDLPIEYDTLTSIGSMMGSGGMIVMDEDNCMVDIAKFYLEFSVDESCGKCTPCRIGNKRILELLKKITDGTAVEEDLEKISELCEVVRDASLCGLGEAAPNPVLSTLKFFNNEYKEHVIDKKCTAGVCKGLVKYEVTDSCIGCTKCLRACPVLAIKGKIREKHIINIDKCIRCGLCYEACPTKAIIKTSLGGEF
ncbi:MAG: NADH-ubiquinone oxidoreductase-F iron-sulfur binding region domain-containing protein [Clostridium sp.]|uniref:NADH-ubiquinone oxidoreductase-F iron-sulfur binding region domain-containing protein n=1 Tax=Clostridium sp. TaxID=1506 RepID=UPI001ED2E484|nr:NADH-ubiquinone oxidoreductase-F iron-sulfur binding region domain-containing protein [Clostridium sp.]MBS5885897.1 4Fe-4S binding protein [Clostridium sp.]MDU7149807.1 NADH-ubiquinone oxidoreductase-F iron-sulfur binding region domain-containing protein [Clostridium sp.]MDU7242328.1 NADH-ubiquinone oxidoreductase-F iron-sulfur binding region domain-containing protein [Clostridium sp.]